MSTRTVAVLVAVAVAVGMVLYSQLVTPRLASAQPTGEQVKFNCNVPKTFGTFRAASAEGLFFEAPDGTIRLVYVENCRVMGVYQRN